MQEGVVAQLEVMCGQLGPARGEEGCRARVAEMRAALQALRREAAENRPLAELQGKYLKLQGEMQAFQFEVMQKLLAKPD
mmetsp:Transcript_14143/g.37826  ORF Transcript_14143/g.37826 Transcript_14143/m.37826 type:complete len:80 (-) Transcript_14143:9-248(-)